MTAELIRSRRKTLSLQVRPDGSVLVRAPLMTSKREIQRFLDRHTDWVLKQQARMLARAAAAELVPQLSGEELNALKKAARKDLTARVETFAAQMGVSYGRISIRHQKSKWGSCSSSGNLNLNCLLMLTPEFVRDYVVVHELSHRRHMNHSPAFWAEVARILPDYKSARAWLRENGTAVMDRNPVP